jgi:AraC-like DNA-binding protein
MRIAVDDFLISYVQSLEAYFLSSIKPDKNILLLKFEELLLNIFTRPAHQDIANYFKSLSMENKIQLEQIMLANFAYNLQLCDYAQLCNMSLSSFKRSFKTVFNTSPGKWLCEKKVKRAAQVLRTSDKSIGQVALDTGFEDTSHFIKVFKQQFGATPLNYRKDHVH